MVSNKQQTYYTFRRAADRVKDLRVHYECTKWSEDGDVLGKYHIAYFNRVTAGACDCPAFRACKHTKALHDWIQRRLGDDYALMTHTWSEKDGWQKMKDFDL